MPGSSSAGLEPHVEDVRRPSTSRVSVTRTSAPSPVVIHVEFERTKLLQRLPREPAALCPRCRWDIPRFRTLGAYRPIGFAWPGVVDSQPSSRDKESESCPSTTVVPLVKTHRRRARAAHVTPAASREFLPASPPAIPNFVQLPNNRRRKSSGVSSQHRHRACPRSHERARRCPTLCSPPSAKRRKGCTTTRTAPDAGRPRRTRCARCFAACRT